MKNKLTPDTLEWTSEKVKGFSKKILLELEHGSLKMIMVAPFATYPIHTHPDKTEFIYLIKGKVKVTIGGVHYEGQTGDFFIFPISIEHSIENPSSSNLMLLVGSIKN